MQHEYDARIEELLDEIEELRDQRDEDMRAVLTDDQKKMVDLAKTEARKRRAERRESK